jgi:uncharacterized protein (TIRG00374 family)
MTTRRALPWVFLVVVVALLGWKLGTTQFDWKGFAHSLRAVNLRLISLAFVVVNLNNPLRAMRWALFLRPALRSAGRRPKWTELVGAQFIGFTALALFGRLGELVRPLLISRRTGLTFSSQIAVVAVERVFDLMAFGLIFAVNLLVATNLRGIPYLSKAGYFIAAMTLFLVVFVVLVRVAGEALAHAAERVIGMVSTSAGESMRDKILGFQSGLNVIDSFADFALAASLSFVIWITIAIAYILVIQAFPDPVRALTPGHTIVLMGFSIAGSALPIPGGSGAWAGNTYALGLFGIPGEFAASAGLLLWIVLNMSVVPGGLLFSRLEGISLRSIVTRSEAGEEARS